MRPRSDIDAGRESLPFGNPTWGDKNIQTSEDQFDYKENLQELMIKYGDVLRAKHLVFHPVFKTDTINESKDNFELKIANDGKLKLFSIASGKQTPAQIGSKYIRIPDLNDCKLNIVYASRKKVGPAREISKEFQSVLKDLVYNQNISQAAYDELSIDDQKLFKEVLAATHIQHAFKDELPDPMSNLRMEYEKLKGELMLGNDNPSIIKQLKTITVDMYANRLIGDSEFKDIIVRLI
ncbi:hypothetical protein BBJ28_00022182 [Nothophytophthora sp. Chile5]|nr:hypothetical protein BBJ28_00022182 [Nothophytophthora sp. Chile5]